MVRTLIIIIGAGLVLAAACFAGAFAIGGRDFVRNGWAPPWADDDWDWDGGEFRGRQAWTGPVVTREIAWSDSEEIEIGVPADVVFTEGPTRKLTVTGPKSAVDRVVLEGDRLGFSGRRRPPWAWGRGFASPNGGRLKIALTAPDTESFSLMGSASLDITGFDGERLELKRYGSGRIRAAGKTRRLELAVHGSGKAELEGLVADEAEVEMMGSGQAAFSPQVSAEVVIHGSGDVVGAGRADKVKVEIFGSGDADLSKIDAKDAEVEIMGSGTARLAPKGVVDVSIFGSGDVTLATRPATLRTKTAGSGRVEQLTPETAAP